MEFKLIEAAVFILVVLAISALVGALGLGSDVRLRGEAQAKALAQAAFSGFVPIDIAMDRAGIGALLRGADGRFVMVSRCGARFIVRLLDRSIMAKLDLNFLSISTNEQMVDLIKLDLGKKAPVWASALRHL